MGDPKNRLGRQQAPLPGWLTAPKPVVTLRGEARPHKRRHWLARLPERAEQYLQKILLTITWFQRPLAAASNATDRATTILVVANIARPTSRHDSKECILGRPERPTEHSNRLP